VLIVATELLNRVVLEECATSIFPGQNISLSFVRPEHNLKMIIFCAVLEHWLIISACNKCDSFERKNTYIHLFIVWSDHSSCYCSIIKMRPAFAGNPFSPLVFSVTLFHRRVPLCQPPASKQPFYLLKMHLFTHIKAHSCLENICNFSLHVVLQFWRRKWIVLHFFFLCTLNSCVVPNFIIKLSIADTGA
jgi:hypothetical protein